MEIEKGFFLLMITVICCCSSCSYDYCYQNGYQNITSYDVSSNAITEGGIRVDTSGFLVNLDEIDRQVDDMEACLRDVFLSLEVSNETLVEQGCINPDFDPDITIRRDCLIVKIAPDWSVSQCSGQEIFPCDINPQVCENKGLEVTEECPCMCRSTIQDENTVVTTPNLYLLRGELGRMVTGCNNPWFGRLSSCFVD